MITRARRAHATLWVMVAVVSGVSVARADLEGDLRKVAAVWSAEGLARVIAPRLLTQGTLLPIALEPAETDPGSDACTSIVILGAPSTSFVVRFLPDLSDAPAPPVRPEISVGGAVQLSRCGRRRSQLARAVLDMRSPRGIVQAVVARGERPFQAFQHFLSHRKAGAAAVAASPGPRPSSPPVTERAARLQQELRREGAARVSRRLVPASGDGLTAITFELEPGCHQIHALGISATSGAGPGLDVDMELSWASDGTVVASDRSDSPDAVVSVCTGDLNEAVLTVAGASAGMPMLVVYATWALPAGLPARWGGAPRAAVAEAMRAMHVDALPAVPAYEVLGVAGTTRSPVELEPDACYVLAVAPLREGGGRLSVAVEAGTTLRRSTETSPRGAAMLAFCANGANRGHVDVEAHGESASWLSALWQIGRVRLGSTAEGP